MLRNATVPVVGFVAPSGTGKTQLLKALITRLKSKGFKVAVIKHSHHDFEIDKPGKDSYELRMSGAAQMLIASKYRWAIIRENENSKHEVRLNTLIQQLDQTALDIILVEGFTCECFPKIEVYRPDSTYSKPEQTPLFLSDPDIIAIASDKTLVPKDGITLLDINNIKQISQFIIQSFSLKMPPSISRNIMPDKNSPSLPSCNELDPDSLQVEQARNKILKSINPPVNIKQLPLRDTLNRVLANSVKSTIDVPSHTNSAMDGYAISGTDIPTTDTKKLTIVGTVMAGRPLDIHLATGECVRIMTGGKIPAGADTVIMQEHVQRNDDEKFIRISPEHQTGQNIRQAGEDLSRGDVIFQSGRCLTPADLGMLASMGIAEVPVFERVKVIFFSTGDELCSVGQTLKEGQIYDSNRYTLYGMLQRLDVDFVDMGVIPDQRERVEDAFRRATAEADVVVTTGGVSVGDADFVKETLEKLGHIGFWKIAMKPGRPLAFGHVGNCQFFGLPGNPVSAMVTFYQFVQPALLHMMGIKDVAPKYLYLRNETTLKKRTGRSEFQRGIISNTNGETVVRATGAQGSGILSSMSEANCFIELPAEVDKIEAGEKVKVQPFAGMI